MSLCQIAQWEDKLWKWPVMWKSRKLRSVQGFSNQIDESTEDSSATCLFWKSLPGRTTGAEIFKALDDFFKDHDILWHYVEMEPQLWVTARLDCIDNLNTLYDSSWVPGLQRTKCWAQQCVWYRCKDAKPVVFAELNKLNSSIQGRDANFLQLYEKLEAFV